MQAQERAESGRRDALDAEGEYPERYGWYVVFVLCVCGVVAFIDRQIINLLVEDIKRDLAVTDTDISLLQGFAFVLLYATAAIPLGRLADHTNRRVFITVGILLWTAAAIACGLAQSYAQLFVGRIFIGIGEAVLTPAGFSLLADYFRPRRLALPISVFTGASFFGSGIALLVGGYIVGLLGAMHVVRAPLLGELEVWQAAFLLGATPGLLAALLFFATVREPRRRAAAASAPAGADPTRRISLRETVAFCAQHKPVFLAIFVGLSLLGGAQFSLGAWTPAFFIRVHGWPAERIGYAYGTLFLTCGAFGVVAGGWIADRLHARGWRDANLRTAMLAALCSAPFAIAFPLVADPRVAVVLLAPMVLFGTMPFGAGTAVIPIVAPPQLRAQLTAVYLLAANFLGQAGGPWLVAFFTDRVFGSPLAVGRSLMIVAPSLLLAGAALIAFGLPSLRRMLGSPDD